MTILDIRAFQALFEIVINFFDAIFFILILCTQLGLKKWVTKKRIFLCVTLSSFVLITYNYFTQNHITSLTLAIVALIIFSTIFIKGKLGYKLFWMAFPAMLLFCIETLTMSTMLALHPDPLTVDFAEFGVHRVVGTIIAKALLVVVLYFLVRYKLNLETFGYTVLSVLTALPALWLSILVSVYHNFVSRRLTDPIILFHASIVVLVQTLLLLALIVIINKAVKRNLDRELLTRDEEHLTKKNEILNVVVHKFQNYQDGMDEIAQNLWHALKDDYDNENRYERIMRNKEILAEIAILRESYDLAFYTGDDIIDIVLTCANQRARAKDILLRHDIDLPVGFPCDSSVIGGLLMHVLDNAAQTIDTITDVDGNKIIDLTMKMLGSNMFSIRVEYPADDLIEAKKNLDHQDTALRVVHGLVKRYRGEMKVSCEGFWFTVAIALPVDAIKEKPTLEGVLQC